MYIAVTRTILDPFRNKKKKKYKYVGGSRAQRYIKR